MNEGGSLHTTHSAEVLGGLCTTATIAELDEDAEGRRCFVLQHPSEPSARLAELWVLPPNAMGPRFDAGLAGAAGYGPTLQGARAHDQLPLASAAMPLVTHVVKELRRQEEDVVEAAAALPGFSAWVSTLTAAELDAAYGQLAADAAMMMALASERGSTTRFPSRRQCTIARPAWTALAEEYARTAAAEEAALYRAAGAEDVGIAYLADTSPDALRRSGGAMALLSWTAPTPSENERLFGKGGSPLAHLGVF